MVAMEALGEAQRAASATNLVGRHFRARTDRTTLRLRGKRAESRGRSFGRLLGGKRRGLRDRGRPARPAPIGRKRRAREHLLDPCSLGRVPVPHLLSIVRTRELSAPGGVASSASAHQRAAARAGRSLRVRARGSTSSRVRGLHGWGSLLPGRPRPEPRGSEPKPGAFDRVVCRHRPFAKRAASHSWVARSPTFVTPDSIRSMNAPRGRSRPATGGSRIAAASLSFERRIVVTRPAAGRSWGLRLPARDGSTPATRRRTFLLAALDWSLAPSCDQGQRRGAESSRASSPDESEGEGPP